MRKTFGIWISGLLLAAFAIGVLAPVAEAGKGSRRYKHHSSKYYRSGYDRCSPTRVVEIHRSSSAGPAIAGFIGGLVLGTAISRASEPEPYYRPAVREREYDYYDPYCDDHFASLVSYRRHAYHRHPTIVRVIEIDTGRCVHVYRYQRGGWADCDEEDEYYNY
jgi:hypothetical protein